MMRLILGSDHHRPVVYAHVQQGLRNPYLQHGIANQGFLLERRVFRCLAGVIDGSGQMLASEVQRLVEGQPFADAEDRGWIGDELFMGIS